MANVYIDLDELQQLYEALLTFSENVDAELTVLNNGCQACVSAMSNDKISMNYARELALLSKEIGQVSDEAREMANAVKNRKIDIEMRTERL